MNIKYICFFSIFLFLISACSKAPHLPTQRADIFLKKLEKGDSVSHTPDPRAFSDGKISSIEDSFHVTPQSLLKYIKENKLPSEDIFSLEKLELSKSRELWGFLPRLYANMSVNYPLYGYELQYYQDNSLWSNVYTYLSITWNSNIFSKFTNMKRTDAEIQLLNMQNKIAKEQILSQALSLYFAITEKQQGIKLLQKELALQEREYAFLQENIHGTHTKHELKDSEIKKQNLEISLTQQNYELEKQKRDFAELLETNNQLKFPQKTDTITMNHKDLSMWKAEAEKKSSTVILARQAAKSLLDVEKYIKYERFTNFNFYVSLPQVDIFDNDSTRNSSVNVGVRWSVPIFDAGETHHKYAEINIQKRSLAHKTNKELKRLDNSIEEQYFKVDYLKKLIRQHEDLLIKLQENHTFLEQEAEKGEVELLSVLKSEIDVLRKKTEIEKYNNQLQFAYLSLQVLAGEIDL